MSEIPKVVSDSPLIVTTHHNTPLDWFSTFMPQKLRDWMNAFIIKANPVFINRWAFIHLISGILVGLFMDNWLVALVLHTVYEIWEWAAGPGYMGRTLTKVVIIDSVIDTVFYMVGFFVVQVFMCFKKNTQNS